MKRTQGRISRHSILAYVLGWFLKINTTVIFSFFTPFFPSFWTAFHYVCTHWQLKPFTDVENHMLGYYRQDTSCSLKWIFQVFCQMPRKNHLDISYSRLQHNQECRSKTHLKEEQVKALSCGNEWFQVQFDYRWKYKCKPLKYLKHGRMISFHQLQGWAFEN